MADKKPPKLEYLEKKEEVKIRPNDKDMSW